MPAPPATPKSWAARFHEYVSVPRVMLACLAAALFTVGIACPAVLAYERTRNNAHISRAQQIAEDVALTVDEQMSNMFGALTELRGFVVSGTPLRAPTDYFTQNISAREAMALDSGNPGALSQAGYERVRQRVVTSFVGYINAAIHAGLVNTFVDPTSPIRGQDWLFFNENIHQEMVWIVEHGQDMLRPTRPATSHPGRWFVIVRSPVFTNLSKVNRDPNAIDPATGRHPNWRCLWGAISLVMDMGTLGEHLERRYAHRLRPEFEYLFESREQTEAGIFYPQVTLANSTPHTSFADAAGHEPVRACSNAQSYGNVCFSLYPISGWDGDDLASTITATVLLALFLPTVAIVVLVGAARLVVGPEPDPLRFAPKNAPFHAACVDITDANRLWVEVPFVMHEVTMLFGAEVERQAELNRAHVSLRHGTTAIAVSSSREAVIGFARGMAAWGQSAPWPPHITVHCPCETLALSCVLHTCSSAEVRTVPEARTCEVSGADVQALLLMRVAAVPQHVICTSEFLSAIDTAELRRLAINSRSALGLSNAAVANELNRSADTVDSSEVNKLREQTTRRTLKLLGQVGELGVCELPLPQHDAPSTLVRGFLAPSAATDGRDIEDVIDSFPDSVWAEWRSANAYQAQPQSMLHAGDSAVSRALNPLAGAASAGGTSLAGLSRGLGTMEGASTSMGGGAAPGGSKTASMSLAGRRVVGSAHLNNGGADAFLPASAVDPADLKRLARMLVPALGRAVEAFEAAAAGAARPGEKQEAKARLQAAVSLATYYLTAYRLLFAPLEPPVRAAMVGRICAAVGVAPDDYAFGLAVRCTVLSMRYVDEGLENNDAL